MTAASQLSDYPPVSPPEAELRPSEVIARAIAMRDTLRARHAKSDAARCILPETYEEFRQAGFHRILQPRHFGGYELDLPTLLTVVVELARGCPGSAWSVAHAVAHTHVLAKYPLKTQADAYGDSGEFRAALRQVDQSTANRVRVVDGGYVVNGHWDHASGCDVATHFFGGSRLPRDLAPDGNVEIPTRHRGEMELLMLFERKDFEIVDNWDTLGMRAAGSKRIVVRDAFVPRDRAEHVSWIMDGVEGRDPAWRSPFASPIYLGPSSPISNLEMGAVALGTGLGALDAYEQILKARVKRGAIARVDFMAWSKRILGQAISLLATSERALRFCAREYMELCDREASGDAAFDNVRDQTFILVVQQCVRLAAEAVDVLFRAGGTTGAKADAMLGRYFRDMSTLRTHAAFQFDVDWETFGERRLGLHVG